MRPGESGDLALDALEQAVYDRQLDGATRLIHHRDRGTQYLSIRYTERLAEAGIERSVGRTGDSYDNALAEFVIGLYKTEVIHRRGPWKGIDEVEFATFEWVAWYKTRRPARAAPLRSARRVRAGLLQPPDGLGRAGCTHVTESPGNSGRFTTREAGAVDHVWSLEDIAALAN